MNLSSIRIVLVPPVKIDPGGRLVEIDDDEFVVHADAAAPAAMRDMATAIEATLNRYQRFCLERRDSGCTGGFQCSRRDA